MFTVVAISVADPGGRGGRGPGPDFLIIIYVIHNIAML